MEPGFHGVRTPWIRGSMAFPADPAGPGGNSAGIVRDIPAKQQRNIGQLTDVSDMQVAEIFLVQQASGGIAPGAFARGQPVQVTAPPRSQLIPASWGT